MGGGSMIGLNLSSPAFVAATGGGGAAIVMTGSMVVGSGYPYYGAGGPGIGSLSMTPTGSIITLMYNGVGFSTAVTFPFGNYTFEGTPVVVDGNGINGSLEVILRVGDITTTGTISGFTSMQANLYIADDVFGLQAKTGNTLNIVVSIP
jgi:hypothetical protein